ncbi:hypothetical protein ACQP2X_47950 [Actinoplanes sp. CA-131856]
MRLPNPQNFSGIFGQPSRTLDTDGIFYFREAGTDSQYNIGDLDLDYITFLAWVQRRFWRLRRKSPELISLYGYDCNEQSRSAVSLLFGDEGAGWFQPPFHWSDKDTFAYGTAVGSNTAMQYISSVAAFTAMHDAISNARGIRKGIFPPDLHELPFWTEIETMLRERLSPDIW